MCMSEDKLIFFIVAAIEAIAIWELFMRLWN